MTKIAVADDDHKFRDLIIFALRFAGYDVLGVENGEESYKLAKLNQPDLILVDVSMPKMNGLEACKALKADKDTRSIPVIFLMARGEETKVQAGINAGGEDYILKSISPDQLTEKVNKFLHRLTK